MSAHRGKAAAFFLLGFVWASLAGLCQNNNSLGEKLMDLLADRVSGETAMSHVIALAGWPRIRPADEYTGVFFEARYVLDKALSFGLDKARIEHFPWKYPNWAPITAELKLVEPQTEILTNLDMVPLCLLQDSKSADVRAEVVYVGEGTSPGDYAGKDVKGKLVLSSGYENLVNHEAVHLRGAAGVLSFGSLYPDDYPDNVAWGGFSSMTQPDTEKYTFGFMLSPRQGNRLKRLLERGTKVVAEAHVQSRTYPGKLDIVSAVIPGRERPGEEILLLAHLFEYYYMQGANDNASGCAALLEAARALQQLIRDGKIPPPRRSIRFFWEPEGFGTYAVLAKTPEFAARLKAVIDMDMVGEGHRQCGSIFNVLVTPDSLPHFFNDVVESAAEAIRERSGFGRRTETQSFSELLASPTGSRNPFYLDVIHFNPRIFNENWMSVPHILFHCSPDPFYHSMEDRPDKCDATQLKRVALLGACAAYTMANLGPEDIPLLSSLVLEAAEKRLAEDRRKAVRRLSGSGKADIHRNHEDAVNIIKHGLRREEGVLRSIGEYLKLPPEETKALGDLIRKGRSVPDATVENLYSRLCRSMNIDKEIPALTAEEKRLSNIVPKRIVGLEYSDDFRFLQRVLGDPGIREKILLNKAGSTVAWEALNYADGKRTLRDIRDALRAEFSPAPISPEMIEQFFEILEKAGVVSQARIH